MNVNILIIVRQDIYEVVNRNISIIISVAEIET